MRSWQFQKDPRVRKILVRNSGAGNGRAKFMDAYFSVFFLQENLHVHKIPRFRGGIWGLGGEGSADFVFMGAGISLTIVNVLTPKVSILHRALADTLLQLHLFRSQKPPLLQLPSPPQEPQNLETVKCI